MQWSRNVSAAEARFHVGGGIRVSAFCTGQKSQLPAVRRAAFRFISRAVGKTCGARGAAISMRQKPFGVNFLKRGIRISLAQALTAAGYLAAQVTAAIAFAYP